MSMTVHNTTPSSSRVTLFGRLEGGDFAAEVMEEASMPYAPYWQKTAEQVVVYIDPSEEQLHRMVEALKKGKLEFDHLQDFGAANGGTSDIPIEDQG